MHKKLFYANNDSSLFKKIKEFNHFCLSNSFIDITNFIENQKNNYILLQPQDINSINELYEREDITENVIINFLNLEKDELLTEFKEIKVIENILPFNDLASITINKYFLKEIEINHKNITNPLEIVKNYITEYKNKGLLIKDFNLEFDYDEKENNKGYCNDVKLFIKSNTLNSSTFRHEYFHLMDKYLNKKLITTLYPALLTYSELNSNNALLPKFNNFIKNLSNYGLVENINDQKLEDYLKLKNMKKPEESDLKLYFKNYFSVQFNEVSLDVISDTQLYNEIEIYCGKIYTNGRGENKYTERDNLILELKNYIRYELIGLDKPQKNLFTLFSELKDLNIKNNYFSLPSERLARIYQSQFHNTSDKKLFPLGKEVKLVVALNEIIETEFKKVLTMKNNNIQVFTNTKKLNDVIYQMKEIRESSKQQAIIPIVKKY